MTISRIARLRLRGRQITTFKRALAKKKFSRGSLGSQNLTGENFGYLVKERVMESSVYASRPINFGETDTSIGSGPYFTGFQHF